MRTGELAECDVVLYHFFKPVKRCRTEDEIWAYIRRDGGGGRSLPPPGPGPSPVLLPLPELLEVSAVVGRGVGLEEGGQVGLQQGTRPPQLEEGVGPSEEEPGHDRCSLQGRGGPEGRSRRGRRATLRLRRFSAIAPRPHLAAGQLAGVCRDFVYWCASKTIPAAALPCLGLSGTSIPGPMQFE